MNRESGYYRVKIGGTWRIAEYSELTNMWRFAGIDWQYHDSDFDKDPITGKPMIDPTPINPEP